MRSYNAMKSLLVFLSLIALTNPIAAQDANQCAMIGFRITKVGGRGISGTATKLSDAIKAAGNVTGALPAQSPFAGVFQNQQNDFAGELGSAFTAKCTVQFWMRSSCGCKIKGIDPSFQSTNSNAIASSPNGQTLWFAGDSLTRGADSYGSWGTYLPGYRIENIALSGSTSDDHFYQWNYCASQSVFGHTDRTMQNPQPNPADRNAGSINVQNRRVFLLFGGNDIKTYQTTLQTFPILTWFRYGNVINNYNRYITYVQAQSGANVTILGNFPFPTLDPFEHENYQYVLERLGLHKHYGSLYERNANLIDKSQLFGLLSGNAGLFQHSTAVKMAGMSEFRNPFISKNSDKNFFNKLVPGFASSFLFRSASGDNTWLSQRMLELATAIPVFTANRQVDYIPLYGAFVDAHAAQAGFPWAGNPYLWIYNGGPMHSEMDLPILGLFPNDSIHPGPLGYIAWADTIAPYLGAQDLAKNKVPFGYYDGCNYEPNATAPDASAFSFKPGAALGPLATAEPPPLPAIDDNGMMLLLQMILCFLTGFCH